MMPVVYTEVDGGRLGDERLPRRVAWGSRRGGRDGARSEEISRFPDLGISNRNPSIYNQTMSHYLDDDSEMEEEQEEEYEPISSRKGSSRKKRGRSSSDSDGRRGNKKKPSVPRSLTGRSRSKKFRNSSPLVRFCFIVSGETDLPTEDVDHRQFYQRSFHPHEDFEEDVDEFEKRCLERCSRHDDDDDELEELTDVDQQALLPSVRDPNLWMVKCAIHASSSSDIEELRSVGSWENRQGSNFLKSLRHGNC